MKINKKNLFLIMIVIATLILSGCGEQTITKTSPYVGGNNGLTFEFQEGQPPMEIFDEGNMPFTVGILLKNKGEHGIFDETYEQDDDFEDFGRLTISGVKASAMGLENDDFAIDFEEYGISLMPYKKNPADGTELQGGIATAVFPTLNYMYDAQGLTDLTLGVDMCYNYKTKSTTTLCVVENTINSKNKICDPYAIRETINSGSPVHVTKVTQTPVGNNKISLIVEIQKVNEKGEVFRKINPDLVSNSDKVCDESPVNQDKNKVLVKVYLPDEDETITCAEFGAADEGTVTLNSGDQPKPLSCTLEVDDIDNDYTTSLYVDLEYSFGQFIEKTIQIKDYQ